ncbi:MAG TPA: hypothetical protein VF175_11510 [Lacipirellula sp.]
MASVPEQLVAQSESACEREPNLMRFGLRHLFVFVSLAAVLAALLAQIEGAGSIVIGSLALLVAAHVFGTFLGTRLRDTSQDVQRWKARPGSSDPDRPVGADEPIRTADVELPLVALASYEKLSRWRRLPLALGAAVGAVLGVVGISMAAGNDVTWPGLAMGAVSCGIMGSWGFLLGTNFYAMTRQILRQASSELARDQSRRGFGHSKQSEESDGALEASRSLS